MSPGVPPGRPCPLTRDAIFPYLVTRAISMKLGTNTYSPHVFKVKGQRLTS